MHNFRENYKVCEKYFIFENFIDFVNKYIKIELRVREHNPGISGLHKTGTGDIILCSQRQLEKYVLSIVY
jgi:hypothetical protein